MTLKKCIPCGLLALSIGSVLLSGCSNTTADDLTTGDDSTTVATTVSTTTTIITTTTTTTSSLTPFATVTRDLNGTNTAFDDVTQTFFVALGAEGYASCGGGLNCTVWEAQSFGLSRVDDIAVADGFAFLLDGSESSGRLAVASVNGTVAQPAVEVNSRRFNSVSAVNGRVVVSVAVVGGIQLQTFLYSDNGILAFNSNTSFASPIDQTDVHLPSGNNSLAFVPGQLSTGFGITIASFPNLTELNTVSLSFVQSDLIARSTSFFKKDGSLCLLAVNTGTTSGGLTVVCDPDDPSSTRRRFFRFSGQSIAVGGDRAYVLTRADDPVLVVIDLAPLETGDSPTILCLQVVSSGLGRFNPVNVATNTNGSQVLISTNSQGLLFNGDFTCP